MICESVRIDPPAYGIDGDECIKTHISGSSTMSRSGSLSSDKSFSNSMMSSASSIDSIEDESTLPSYTPLVTKKGLLAMKPELSSPFVRTKNRSWRTCMVEVNNTQIKMSESCFGGLATKTHIYSLQFAEVGLATDYEKRPNSFRLRVESHQFIFDCENREQLLPWLVNIQMAISLALPLELRQLPEEIKRLQNRQRDLERRRAREERRAEERNGESSSRRHRNRQYSNNNKPNKQNADESKWQPRRRSSRFSEKDFPHLLLDTPWEGKSVLYNGQWAQIQNRKLTIVMPKQNGGIRLF